MTSLPVEIIEKIFNFLDFDDKLSFSLCCKKFNEVFSSRKNLEKVWINVAKFRGDVGVKRPYTAISWNCEAIEKEAELNLLTWSRLDQSFTALKIEHVDLLSPSTFLHDLPIHANLTYLDMVVENSWWMRMEDLILIRTTICDDHSDLIVMKTLQYLRVNVELFLYLEGRCVNFASTKKLKTLIFIRNSSTQIRLTSKDFTRIRFLISAQEQLNTLHLLSEDSADMNSLFNELLVQNSLKDFKLIAGKIPLSLAQQENFCNFVASQDQLELVEYEFNLDPQHIGVDRSTINLLRQRLNLPLISQSIDVSHIRVLNTPEGLEVIRSNEIYEGYLSKHFREPSNSMTTKLQIKFDNVNFKQLFQMSQIVQKFPNLTTVTISITTEPRNFGIRRSLKSLGDLVNLENLTLEKIPPDQLALITILQLKRFVYISSGYLEDISEDLINFFCRHPKIQSLQIGALVNFDSEFFQFIDMVLALLYELSLLWLNDERNTFIEADQTVITRLHPIILQSAKPGFIFKGGNDYQIMKRYDNVIVEKIPEIGWLNTY